MTDMTDNDQPVVALQKNEEETDIFLWANNLVQYLEDLTIDLYFFNKNFTLFKAQLGGQASQQLRPTFVEGILETVFDGVEKGMVVRSFEDVADEEDVLRKTRRGKVEGLVEVLSRINGGIYERFNDQDHDLRRMRGVIVQCRHKDVPAFYIVKSLSASNIVKGDTAWLVKDNVLQPFAALSGLKLPADNQLLVVGEDVFVFKESKLKQLFGYDAKEASITAKKAKEIEAYFKLSFSEGLDLQTLLKGKTAIIKKLQKLDPSTVKQEDLLEHAEEMGVELMTDDAGAIIIMDTKDVAKFVNLLNEDYITSPITGERYEIIKKKPLRMADNQEGV